MVIEMTSVCPPCRNTRMLLSRCVILSGLVASR